MDRYERDMAKAAKAATPPPLNPMPIAPPEIAAAWLRRMSIGLLIALAALLLSFLGWPITTFSGNRWVYLAAVAGLYPLLAIANAFATWLETSPEPGNPYWMFPLRLAARIGILAGIATTALIGCGALFHLPQEILKSVTSAYILAQLVVTAGFIGAFWYLSHLARRLGDRVVKLSFGFLKWLGAIVFVLALYSSLMHWPAYYESTLRRIQEGMGRAASAQAASHAGFYMWFGLVMWAFFIWFAWLYWRLFRRLRQTAEKLSPSRQILPNHP